MECIADFWGGHAAFLHLLLLRDEAFTEGPSDSEGGDAPEDGGGDPDFEDVVEEGVDSEYEDVVEEGLESEYEEVEVEETE